jgi:hypothetical protein
MEFVEIGWAGIGDSLHFFRLKAEATRNSGAFSWVFARIRS